MEKVALTLVCTFMRGGNGHCAVIQSLECAGQVVDGHDLPAAGIGEIGSRSHSCARRLYRGHLCRSRIAIADIQVAERGLCDFGICIHGIKVHACR